MQRKQWPYLTNSYSAGNDWTQVWCKAHVLAIKAKYKTLVVASWNTVHSLSNSEPKTKQWATGGLLNIRNSRVNIPICINQHSITLY